MNRVQYNVSGLLNNTIKTQVRNVLSDIDGVKRIDVNIAQGSIGVGFNDSANEKEIRERIEQVGCRIR